MSAPRRWRRSRLTAGRALITVEDLGLPDSDTPPREEDINLREARDAAEYKVMSKALARVDGNILRAAELLGVSRPTLYDLMSHHGIK